MVFDCFLCFSLLCLLLRSYSFDRRSVLGACKGAFAAYPRLRLRYSTNPLTVTLPWDLQSLPTVELLLQPRRRPRQYIPGIGRRCRVVDDDPGRRRDPPPGPQRSASGGAGVGRSTGISRKFKVFLEKNRAIRQNSTSADCPKSACSIV